MGFDLYYKTNEGFAIEKEEGAASPINQHFHGIFEIYYLKEGATEYFIGNTVYALKKGDIAIVPPNTIHKTITVRPRKRVLIYLNPHFLSIFNNKDMGLKNSVSIIHTDGNERINAIFNELIYEYGNEKNIDYIKALMYELLVLISRKDKYKGLAISENIYSNKISAIVDHINENYAADVTLESTAKFFYISPQYLSRIFPENTGLTFSNYLRKYRIKKAIEEMSSTDKNITQIAFDVGFNSTNHFCKAFKSVMNVSPLQFKKLYINTQESIK